MSDMLVMTGGSRGIGAETINLFVEQGWQAINLSRSPCSNPSVININVDLAVPLNRTQHAGQLEALVAGASRIALVHNAAAFERDNVTSLTESRLRAVLELNIVAPVALNTLLLPYMKAGSSIIYIGSTLSEMAVSNRASYVISKHAMVGLMRSTCQDLAGTEIVTTCICPGFVNTDMLTSQMEETALQALVKQKVTQGRLIEPEEIASLIYFCATHAVMNGEVIHANLGQVAS